MYSSGVSGPGPIGGMNVDALHRAAPPSTLTASTTMAAAAERAEQCLVVPYLVPRVAIVQHEDDGFSWLPDDGEEDEGMGGEKREKAASGVVRGSGSSGSGDNSGDGEEKRGNGDIVVVDSSYRSHDEHSGGAAAPANDAEEVEKKGRVRPTHDNAIVLKGLNLTVSSGELVLVVGPVGSGKSTLLAALLGLVSPVPRGRGGGGWGGFRNIWEKETTVLAAPHRPLLTALHEATPRLPAHTPTLTVHSCATPGAASSQRRRRCLAGAISCGRRLRLSVLGFKTHRYAVMSSSGSRFTGRRIGGLFR